MRALKLLGGALSLFATIITIREVVLPPNENGPNPYPNSFITETSIGGISIDMSIEDAKQIYGDTCKYFITNFVYNGKREYCVYDKESNNFLFEFDAIDGERISSLYTNSSKFKLNNTIYPGMSIEDYLTNNIGTPIHYLPESDLEVIYPKMYLSETTSLIILPRRNSKRNILGKYSDKPRKEKHQLLGEYKDNPRKRNRKLFGNNNSQQGSNSIIAKKIKKDGYIHAIVIRKDKFFQANSIIDQGF